MGGTHLPRHVWQRLECLFDTVFPLADNPLRQLGALALFLFWIVAGTGIYLYIVLDTGIDGVHRSIDSLSRQQWYWGGLIRSLHRYGADAFVVIMMLHLLRELMLGRFHGHRLYTWLMGIPLLWLAYASGLVGGWLVWDQRGQYSAVATAELLDVLPIFADPMARNFVSPEMMNDRFFSLLVFMHIGLPLLLVLAIWAHVHRISSVVHLPRRRLALGLGAALALLSLLFPVLSGQTADLTREPVQIGLDWFFLLLHPATEYSSPSIVWSVLLGLTLLFGLLPGLPFRRPAVVFVTPTQCSGCGLCYEDCPYGAIRMEPLPERRREMIARVDADLCASCGICVGSCPSSNPFRRATELVSGIELPQLSVAELRARVDQALSQSGSAPGLILFACERSVDPTALEGKDTFVLRLPCIGMLPPALVEYALRGAAGVLLYGCRSCEFRLGKRWTEQRLAGEREPHHRLAGDRERLCVIWLEATQQQELATAMADFRQRLAAPAGPRSSSRVSRNEVMS
ncbi:cytochrome b N-terminal domain-containing protein [Denitratisoma oestradiolicum]|uniref:Cytochrome b/c1 n=1 Tax=Denitratisoma oestradiolicum TaxID=311182 RepID=A0A6S6XYM3_9PROT|nr:cytochrome b N-terminal domain-containing protein [Denitratisoma oestradiolicum]TWO80341.1 hypothetical protein CBW56_09535 [Denitratisoma oestradiolicum]CAB1370138.1 Cytochrome b/c1 [Denitratisoma oestradiolicum]